MGLSETDAVHITEISVLGLLALLSLVLYEFSAFSKHSRINFLLFLLFSTSLVAPLAEFSNLAISHIRLSVGVFEAFIVFTAIALLFKLGASAWFVGFTSLSSSMALYAFGILSGSSNDEFRTVMISLGGACAVYAAVSMLYVRSRYSFMGVALFFIGVIYYILVLALTIYGPYVTKELSVFQYTVGISASRFLFYVCLAFITYFGYYPANAEAMLKNKDKCEPTDVADFFEWILISDRFEATNDTSRTEAVQ